MQSGLLLNVIVRKGATVFELLASKDEALLIWGNTLLVLNLGLNVLDGVGRLNVKCNSFASEGLDEDLHATAEAEDQVKS